MKGKVLPRAVLVSVVEYGHVLAEHLLALFAGKYDLRVLEDVVVLCLCVTLCAVKPLLAALGADLNLSVQNVLAHILRIQI